MTGNLYPEFRALFEEYSAILLANQLLDDKQHVPFAQLFGDIEDRNADERSSDEAFRVPEVSNIDLDGSLIGASDLHWLHLKSNMLWHADSTFLPRPALTNILISRVNPSSGGNAEPASTRVARAESPEKLRKKIRGKGIHHKYSHSRARMSEELSKQPAFHKWSDQHWNAIRTNPVNSGEALYVASHAFAVDGYDETDGAELIDELIEFCTKDDFVHSHQWRGGDILIWDQRAVLHRGTPRPYDEPRKLSSICATVEAEDGLESMKVTNDLTV